MRRMPYKRPTMHYDERVKDIDEKICELINERKRISDSNPGYPPFEYISVWAEKYGLYEDLLKSLFGSLWNEKVYLPSVEPEIFRRNILALKSVEVDSRIFSITYISQYSNCSIVSLNIDWDNTCNPPKHKDYHTNFELSISEKYYCRFSDGCGGNNHYHYNFVVSPALPDNISGIKLIFTEHNISINNEKIGEAVTINL